MIWLYWDLLLIAVLSTDSFLLQMFMKSNAHKEYHVKIKLF